MNKLLKTSLSGTGIFVLMIFAFLPACKPSSGKSAAKPPKAERKNIESEVVEVRDDRLAYKPGSSTPYSGTVITPYSDMPWLPRKSETWINGQRDGEVREFFKDGTVKTRRRYKRGTPEYACAYHKNGQMKFEINLNSKDKAEGPYHRWYASGKLQAEAGFDADEQWHGASKEWTEKGELKSHLVFEHGVLKEIVFETEEGKADRIASDTHLPLQND